MTATLRKKEEPVCKWCETYQLVGQDAVTLDSLDIILKQHGADPVQHTNRSISTLIDESEKSVRMLADATLRAAGLIASARKIEHCQISAYGTLACWAEHFSLEEDLATLLEILRQDRTFNENLSELAKRDVNPDALQ